MTAGALQRRTRRINWPGGFNNSPRSIEYGQELQVAKLPAASCDSRRSGCPNRVIQITVMIIAAIKNCRPPRRCLRRCHRSKAKKSTRLQSQKYKITTIFSEFTAMIITYIWVKQIII